MFKKKPFYYSDVEDPAYILMRQWNLRHQLIYWMLHHKPHLIEEGPRGDWIVTLSWRHSKIIPGLHFAEA